MNKLYLYLIIYFQVLQPFLVILTYHSKLYLQITVYNLSDEDLEDEVTYQLWDSTDRTSMSTMVSTLGEFIDLQENWCTHVPLIHSKVSSSIPEGKKNSTDFRICHHHYGLCWELWICYSGWSPVVSLVEGAMHAASFIPLHKSFCIMSDDLQHDTCFVYEVLKLITEYCRSNLPDIMEIQYFSDGCAGQYKNFKNFKNLCLHKVERPGYGTFLQSVMGKVPVIGLVDPSND